MNAEQLKFWHCDYCHKGLTAADLHDILNHKVRCRDCAQKQAMDSEIKSKYERKCDGHEWRKMWWFNEQVIACHKCKTILGD